MLSGLRRCFSAWILAAAWSAGAACGVLRPAPLGFGATVGFAFAAGVAVCAVACLRGGGGGSAGAGVGFPPSAGGGTYSSGPGFRWSQVRRWPMLRMVFVDTPYLFASALVFPRGR